MKKLIRSQESERPLMLRDAVNRLFDEAFWDPFRALFPSFADSAPTRFAPSVNMYEDKDNFVIEADVAGFDPKNVNVEIDQNSIIISGKMEEDSKEEDKKYYRRQCSYGQFHHEFALPQHVDASRATCKTKNGMLIVTLPKKQQSAKKQIPIESE